MVDIIPLIEPFFGEEEEAAVIAVLRSGWIMAGPQVDRFETDFSLAVNASHACAVSSCTAGLHLALRAVGVGTGDVILTVSHSFIASANSARLIGAEPVFVDIERVTLNMSPLALEEVLSRDFVSHDGELWYRHVNDIAVGESPLAKCTAPKGRLGAVLVVHQVGLPADMKAIMKLTKEQDIPVIEDAACAIGSRISLNEGATWQPIGTPIGNAVCFSFHPRKIVTTGEGGMITTSDPSIDLKVRQWRQHGMNKSTAERHSGNEFVQETYINSSGNHRMTDLQAAVGIQQLTRLNLVVERRRAIAKRYNEGLRGLNGLTVPFEPSFACTNYQSYMVRLEDVQRVPPFRHSLREQGVDTRPGIMCAHRESPYRRAWQVGRLPESEAAQDNTVILPLYPTMDDDMLDRVINAVRKAVRKFA